MGSEGQLCMQIQVITSPPSFRFLLWLFVIPGFCKECPRSHAVCPVCLILVPTKTPDSKQNMQSVSAGRDNGQFSGNQIWQSRQEAKTGWLIPCGKRYNKGSVLSWQMCRLVRNFVVFINTKVPTFIFHFSDIKMKASLRKCATKNKTKLLTMGWYGQYSHVHYSDHLTLNECVFWSVDPNS